ncbi:MAG: zinc-binding dehydrogenase [Eubacteriales bacterium]|nr:zinc-binding dehydrogenase [Eubacteriales bacterium]
MRAVKIPREKTVELHDVPIPEPEKGWVRVRMKASALCRSDLFRYHGDKVFDDTGDESYITPGHEPCGIVEKLGENVSKVKEGDRVAIYLALGCGVCEHCLSGNTVLCSKFKCIGFALDGAHADYIVVPEECCLPLPDEMDYITGALSTDVGGTLYTACKRIGITAARTVAVFGVGPMGMGGVLMAKAFGAKVIAVDVNEERLALAEELGADHTVNSAQTDAAGKIKQLTKGVGADAAIVCSGVNAAYNGALDCTKKGGSVACIAETHNITIDPSRQLINKRLNVMGCWYFNNCDWKELTQFILEKKIPLSRISTRTYDLEEAEEAFRRFDSGMEQKVVFVWQ